MPCARPGCDCPTVDGTYCGNHCGTSFSAQHTAALCGCGHVGCRHGEGRPASTR